MRFARQARIFRGTLDPAAVASVFLLLLIFLLVSSLIYTPGVLIELGSGPQTSAPTLLITRAGNVVFDGKTYAPGAMEQLRQDLKASPIPPPYTVQREPGAPAKMIGQLRTLFQIQPPVGRSVVGTDNPHVTVAMNFRGQCFFDNQMVSDLELKTRLKERVAAARRQSQELTLILWADRATDNQAQTRMMQLAIEVGIKEVVLAEQAGVWESPAPGRPPKS